MSNTVLLEGEYYHIFNRGVDGRLVTLDKEDSDRFIQSLLLFNVEKPIGSIFEFTLEPKKVAGSQTTWERKQRVSGPLVEIICHCLNPNHYHLILRPIVEYGVQKIMHKIGLGYTNYFNEKYKRSGSLFQGRYKAVHLADNDYLLHASAYVNLNDRVHHISSEASSLVRSSWQEYEQGKAGLCTKEVILDQFAGFSEYKKFAEDSLDLMWQAKIEAKERKLLGID